MGASIAAGNRQHTRYSFKMFLAPSSSKHSSSQQQRTVSRSFAGTTQGTILSLVLLGGKHRSRHHRRWLPGCNFKICFMPRKQSNRQHTGTILRTFFLDGQHFEMLSTRHRNRHGKGTVLIPLPQAANIGAGIAVGNTQGTFIRLFPPASIAVKNTRVHLYDFPVRQPGTRREP